MNPVHAKFEGGPSVELMGQRPLDQFTAVSSVCLPRADLLQLDTRFSPIDMQPLLGSIDSNMPGYPQSAAL